MVSSHIRRSYDEMARANSQSVLWAALRANNLALSRSFTQLFQIVAQSWPMPEHRMSVTERNTRHQGTKCWRNTNALGLPGQHYPRLTSNSRGLGFGGQTCSQQMPKRLKVSAKKHVRFSTRPPELKGWLVSKEGRQGLSYKLPRCLLREGRFRCLGEDEDQRKGIHMRMCNSLGALKEDRRRIKASWIQMVFESSDGCTQV